MTKARKNTELLLNNLFVPPEMERFIDSRIKQIRHLSKMQKGKARAEVVRGYLEQVMQMCKWRVKE